MIWCTIPHITSPFISHIRCTIFLKIACYMRAITITVYFCICLDISATENDGRDGLMTLIETAITRSGHNRALKISHDSVQYVSSLATTSPHFDQLPSLIYAFSQHENSPKKKARCFLRRPCLVLWVSIAAVVKSMSSPTDGSFRGAPVTH